MSIKAFDDRPYGTLEEAVADLIAKAGGECEAARHCRVGKTALSEYASRRMTERHMPLDVILALEIQAEATPVTDFLARSHGMMLVDPKRGVVAGCEVRQGLEVVDHMAGVTRLTVRAVQDGRIDSRERRQIAKACHALLGKVEGWAHRLMHWPKVRAAR